MKLSEFDFRIWNNETGKYETNSTFIAVLMSDMSKGLKEPYMNDIEIELWTGFYDKNGKKIYENDILKNDELDEFYHITRDNTSKMFEINFLEKNPEGKLIRVNGSEYLFFSKLCHQASIVKL